MEKREKKGHVLVIKAARQSAADTTGKDFKVLAPTCTIGPHDSIYSWVVCFFLFLKTHTHRNMTNAETGREQHQLPDT